MIRGCLGNCDILEEVNDTLVNGALEVEELSGRVLDGYDELTGRCLAVPSKVNLV